MLKLMYITNEPTIAMIAENAGVDRIFVDLEINGKEARQGHLDTVISRHNIEDVKKIRSILKKAELIVRVNPIYEKSKSEIDSVIEQGADIIMLPYFKTVAEVKKIVELVNKRAKVCLLCETSEAVEKIDDILAVEGIDEIHIGLNDLHLSYNLDFMFELLINGTVEELCKKFRKAGVIYGFGGIARVNSGDLPSEMIIKEHYRLGSEMAILSRSFCNTKQISNENVIKEIFETGVREIRQVESEVINYTVEQREKNRLEVQQRVKKIVNRIKKGNDGNENKSREN